MEGVEKYTHYAHLILKSFIYTFTLLMGRLIKVFCLCKNVYPFLTELQK